MGRSVSVPTRAIAVAYKDVSYIGTNVTMKCPECGYEDWDCVEGVLCPDCEEGVMQEFRYYDADIAGCEWEDFVDEIKDQAQKLWASFEDCDKWLDREDHAILENHFAYIGISEYCGLVAVWLVMKEFDGYSDDARNTNLAFGWCKRIAPKFEQVFGEFQKIGTFSNGESVYEKIGA